MLCPGNGAFSGASGLDRRGARAIPRQQISERNGAHAARRITEELTARLNSAKLSSSIMVYSRVINSSRFSRIRLTPTHGAIARRHPSPEFPTAYRNMQPSGPFPSSVELSAQHKPVSEIETRAEIARALPFNAVRQSAAASKNTGSFSRSSDCSAVFDSGAACT